MITIHVVVLLSNSLPPVRLASNPAGANVKVVPTRIKSTMVMKRITNRAVVPNSLPIISGRLAPLLRRLIMPER